MQLHILTQRGYVSGNLKHESIYEVSACSFPRSTRACANRLFCSAHAIGAIFEVACYSALCQQRQPAWGEGRNALILDSPQVIWHCFFLFFILHRVLGP